MRGLQIGCIVLMFAPLILLEPCIAQSPGTTVQGSVHDSAGKPVSHATVSLREGKSAPVTTTTDAEGHYRFSLTSAGMFTLEASSPGVGEASAGPFQVNGEKEELKQLDLVLAKPDNATPNTAPTAPQFFDEPSFTVAGVTDSSNLGGHGSNAVAQTKTALAKDVASLGKDSDLAPGAQAGKETPLTPASEQALRQAAETARRQIAQPNISPREKAELHHSLGDAEEKLGDSLAAVHDYQIAAELAPSEANFFDWGAELLLHHAPEPAIQVFTKGNRLFPQSVRMLAALGAAYYANGSVENAARFLNEASDLNPYDPLPYMFLGTLQDADTTHSEAFIEKLQRFAKLQPDNALANYYYALALCKGPQGQEENDKSSLAESLLEKAVRLDPALGRAYLQLGILHAGREDYPGAIAFYRQAIDHNPDLEQAHYRLARAYSMTGQEADAQHETVVYQELTKKNAEQAGRERHEVQQFVYTLRNSTDSPQQ